MQQNNTSQLYVCELSNGVIKVGRSRRNADSRLKAHDAVARIIGETIKRSVIYECKTRSNKHETMLIKRCVDHGGKSLSKEWFSDISFETASNIAFECASIEFDENVIESGKSPDFSMFDALFPGKDVDWFIAIDHAKTIQDIFTNNLFSSEIFEDRESLGTSQFILLCAIQLYKNPHVSYIYQSAVDASNSDDFNFCAEIMEYAKAKAFELIAEDTVKS